MGSWSSEKAAGKMRRFCWQKMDKQDQCNLFKILLRTDLLLSEYLTNGLFIRKRTDIPPHKLNTS